MVKLNIEFNILTLPYQKLFTNPEDKAKRQSLEKENENTPCFNSNNTMSQHLGQSTNSNDRFDSIDNYRRNKVSQYSVYYI